MIPYDDLGRVNARYLPELRQAFENVLTGGWFVLGKEVEAFEKEYAQYIGTRHCIGVASGLDALVLALDALQLAARSEVLVASNTYIATIMAIIRAGHVPVLVEPDLRTYNIDPQAARRLTTAHTRAVCVTHLYGKPCEMDAIARLASERGLAIVEDCAQAHGARWQGRRIGAWGNAGAHSFYPTKNLGCLGDGGAITTDDDALADRLRHLRNYGSKVKYENRYLGYNSRLDELQAAFLRVKLRHLEEINAHKRQLAAVYRQQLPSAVIQPLVQEDAQDVHHIFNVRHAQRDALRAFLAGNGVNTEIHYPIPPHRQEAMKPYLHGSYPLSEEIHRTTLSLPISTAHTEADVQRVSQLVRQFAESQ